MSHEQLVKVGVRLILICIVWGTHLLGRIHAWWRKHQAIVVRKVYTRSQLPPVRARPSKISLSVY